VSLRDPLGYRDRTGEPDLAAIFLTFTGLFGVSLALGFLFSGGCKTSANTGYRAEIVPGPAGASCFAIVDGEGKAVGGNCQREYP
jgi:hypothetical protein